MEPLLVPSLSFSGKFLGFHPHTDWINSFSFIRLHWSHLTPSPFLCLIPTTSPFPLPSSISWNSWNRKWDYLNPLVSSQTHLLTVVDCKLLRQTKLLLNSRLHLHLPTISPIVLLVPFLVPTDSGRNHVRHSSPVQDLHENFPLGFPSKVLSNLHLILSFPSQFLL